MKANIILSLICVLTLSSCSQNSNTSEPKQVKVDPFIYCALEVRGSWSQFNAAVKALEGELEKQNISTHGELISIWHSYPETTEDADYKWEVGYKTSNTTPVNSPLIIKKWETKTLYRQLYDGPSEGVSEFFKSYWKWFENNNLSVVRPLLEITYPETEIGDNQSKFEVLVEATKN